MATYFLRDRIQEYPIYLQIIQDSVSFRAGLSSWLVDLDFAEEFIDRAWDDVAKKTDSAAIDALSSDHDIQSLKQLGRVNTIGLV